MNFISTIKTNYEQVGFLLNLKIDTSSKLHPHKIAKNTVAPRNLNDSSFIHILCADIIPILMM